MSARGEPSVLPLHFIWILDCSASMRGDKIQTLNTVIRETIPELKRAARENPQAQLLVRAIKFSSGAQWYIAQPTPIENFKWTDVEADEKGDMGKALLEVAEHLQMLPIDRRGLPPILVLVSGITPTNNVSVGLKALMDTSWGKKAIRLAVGIGGKDADYYTLQKFINNPEIKPLRTNNPEFLVNYIKWSSGASRMPIAASFETEKPVLSIPESPITKSREKIIHNMIDFHRRELENVGVQLAKEARRKAFLASTVKAVVIFLGAFVAI
jgi:uncharacterized protein YegL